MNKLIDILIKNLKKFFLGTYVDDTGKEVTTRKKEEKKIEPCINSLEERHKDKGREETKIVNEPVRGDVASSVLEETINLPVFKKSIDLKPRTFKGFDNFPNKDTPIRKLTKQEFDGILEENRNAQEDLLETNERGDVLMGRDPETNQGFYMSISEINHIKKVMYYNKKRK